VLLLATLLPGNSTLGYSQERNTATRPGVADMLEKITPAVVNIAVTGHQTLPENPLLNDPFSGISLIYRTSNWLRNPAPP